MDQLKESLEKYETAFNFVGLYQGFDELAKDKTNEKNTIRLWIIVIGITIIMPMFFEIYWINSNAERINEIKYSIIFSLLPTFSLMAVFIYYFRILIYNYKSVKSQLLQIELRKTLCRFIQNYAKYSTDIKGNNSESLSKFENIIFSGIVSNDDKLPSTYDGLEQIGNIFKSMKNSTT